MSDLQEFPIRAGPANGKKIKLRLRRRERRNGVPVLLLHGGSAKSGTFLVPGGVDANDEPRCLADWLWTRGFEPWLLDWRGSGTIAATELERDLKTHRDLFDLDNAARYDLTAALDVIKDERGSKKVAVVAHCLGGAVLAQAIADPRTKIQDRLSSIVLLALGLFYEPQMDSRLKSEDYTLDRLLQRGELAIDPRRRKADMPKEWPREFEEMYVNWPRAGHPHRGRRGSHVEETCDRLSFMYGVPYRESKLAPEIHHRTTIVHFEYGEIRPAKRDTIESEGASAVLHSFHYAGDWGRGSARGRLNLIRPTREFKEGSDLFLEGRRVATAVRVFKARGPELPEQFGPIPLPMFTQGAQNVRRRFAAPLGAAMDDTRFVREQARGAFRQLPHVTLITGERNSLWNRDSIDRMYEWLAQGGGGGSRCTKRVIRSYCHQDLLWGEMASIEVFPRILKGLGPS